MLGVDIKRVGIYLLLWKDGGHSVASVGVNDHGDRWFAPTNWGGTSVPSYRWDLVDKAILLMQQHDPNVRNAVVASTPRRSPSTAV